MTEQVETLSAEVEPSATDEVIQDPNTQEDVSNEGEEPEGEEQPKFDPFTDERVTRKVTRLERTIGKKHAQYKEMQERVQQLEKQLAEQQPKEAQEAPALEDAVSVEKWVQDSINYALQQNQSQKPENRQDPEQLRKEAYEQAQYQLQMQQRQQIIGQKLQEVVKTHPDYQDVLEENADIIDDLPVAIQDVFKFSDNPPLAMYNIAKSGQLEQLAYMNPYQAANVIAAAAQQQPRPVSKAPAPMKGNTGANTGNTTNMSGRELRRRAGLID